MTARGYCDYIYRVGPYSESVSDAELLARLGNDRSAFEQFYLRHFDTVTRFLARRCATPEDVADATSATFLCVMLSSATYNPAIGKPLAWLYAIAANEAKRIHRKNMRHDALGNRVRGSVFLYPDDADRLAEMIDAERRAATIRLVITEAPQAEQDLLRHMVEHGSSPAEAAHAIGVSSGAGRMRLSRLRNRFKEADARTAAGASGWQSQPQEEGLL